MDLNVFKCREYVLFRRNILTLVKNVALFDDSCDLNLELQELDGKEYAYNHLGEKCQQKQIQI